MFLLPSFYQFIVTALIVLISNSATAANPSAILSPLPTGFIKQGSVLSPTTSAVGEAQSDNKNQTSQMNFNGFTQNQTNTPIHTQSVPLTVTLSPAEQISPTQSPEKAEDRIITAKSELSSGGKTITLTLTYPSGGGEISGSIAGDCSGTVSGSYSGQPDSTLSGNADALCNQSFIKIPVKIAYDGKLLGDQTQAELTYTIFALGLTQEGKTTLQLSD